jgi:hypothetical protein
MAENNARKIKSLLDRKETHQLWRDIQNLAQDDVREGNSVIQVCGGE